jgi:hypothetical protein
MPSSTRVFCIAITSAATAMMTIKPVAVGKSNTELQLPVFGKWLKVEAVGITIMAHRSMPLLLSMPPPRTFPPLNPS